MSMLNYLANSTTRQAPSRPKKIDVSHKRRSSIFAGSVTDSAPSWRSGPPSPALSSAGSLTSTLSWFAEKSSAELIPLLKEAYSALRDKERDLLLAAEIGKSLLDNNIALKSKYEALVQQLQAYQEQQQQARYTVTLSAPAQNATQNAATTTPTTHNNDSAVELNVISDNDTKSDVDAGESADDDAEGRSNRTRRLMSSQKSPEVESLEQEKYELLAKLDAAIQESETAERTHNRKVRRLENEVQSLRAELESASKKVEDLEEMNEKLVQKQKTVQQQHKRDSNDSSVHKDTAPEALIEKITVLEQEHEDISSAKEELEQKLASTVKDLNALKEQFEQVQLTQNDYIALQEAYERQLKHISELNQSLDEHRNLLQAYGDNRSVSAWSPKQSPAPSESGSSRWSGRDAGGMKRRTKPSLLSELENEFYKDMKQGKEIGSITESEENVESSDLSMTASTEASELSADKTAARTGSATANLTETSLASLYLSPAEMALESLLQQAGMKTCQMAQLQPMANYMEYDDEYDDDEYDYEYERGSSYMTDIAEDDDSDSLIVAKMSNNEVQKNLSFFGRLFSWFFRLIRRIFRMIWRWCRFWGVLAAALLISIWKGPDAVLEKEAW